nr:hypothetical protein CFP56_31978 [Quercus suber]
MGKEVVRQQAPDILRKRSRLCCYEDSLKVLTTNKGSENIRGIICIRLPKLIKQKSQLENLTDVNLSEDCMLLDTQSPSGLLNQVIEIIGILPSRVCDEDISMDSQFSNHFPTETEGIEYEDRDGDRNVLFWGTEMPNWFNHQSVDNSIVFFVGHKFPKLAVCFVSGQDDFIGFLDISINGYENCGYKSIDLLGNHLCLFSPTQRSLQKHLNESNPIDQNLVEVSIRYKSDDTCYSIKRWGVHIECICPPKVDDAVDYGYSIKRLGVQGDDVEYLPTSKKQRTLDEL